MGQQLRLAATFVMACVIPQIAEATPISNQSAVEQVEREIDRAESIEAIKRLTYIFGYYRDAFQHAKMLELFTHDATYDFGNGQYVGKESLHRLFDSPRFNGGARNPHESGPALLSDRVMMQPVITLADDHRSAQARIKEFVFEAEHGVSQTYGIGILENSYVRADGGEWKIAAVRHCYRLKLPYDVGILELPESEGVDPMPSFHPEDPWGPDRQSSYYCHRYPQVGIDPSFHFDHPVTGEHIDKP